MFNHIVKNAAAKRREKYEDFLSQVKILESLEPYKISKLVDAFKEETHKPGDYVIREDEQGDVFYFISDGEAIATKTLDAGKASVMVMQYKWNDYFDYKNNVYNIMIFYYFNYTN